MDLVLMVLIGITTLLSVLCTILASIAGITKDVQKSIRYLEIFEYMYPLLYIFALASTIYPLINQ